MLLATHYPESESRFRSRHKGAVMEQELALALRERAISALEASTTMLEVAQDLLKQGNQKEAARLRNEARYKRNESILLMDQAKAVEQHQSRILSFPARNTAPSNPSQRNAASSKSLKSRTG